MEVGFKLSRTNILEYKLVEKLKEEINNPDGNNIGVIIFLLYECLYDVNYENSPASSLVLETGLSFGNRIFKKNKNELENFGFKSKDDEDISWGNTIKDVLDVLRENMSDSMKDEIKIFIEGQDPELFTQQVMGKSYDFWKAFISGKEDNHSLDNLAFISGSPVETETETAEAAEGKIYKVTVFDSKNNILKKHKMNKYGQMVGGSKELLNTEEYVIKKIKHDMNYKNNNIYGINKYFGWTVNKEGKRIDNSGNFIYLKK